MIVMFIGLIWNRWSFLLLFSVIHFGCWSEYLRLTEKIHKTTFHIYTKLGWMVMGYGLMLFFCGPWYQINGYLFKDNLSLPVSAAGFALLLIGIFQKKAINLKAFGMASIGLVYISLCWGLMLDLNDVELSRTLITPTSNKTVTAVMVLPFVIVVTLWINDTMAYLVGSFLGKTPLTKISPKKTWEGTLGGIVLAVVGVGFLFTRFSFSAALETYHWYLICLITALIGTMGDLLESKLKRMANVKDSGRMMPGHGGFLDRFDSLLLATPAIWLYVMLVIF